MGQGLLGPFEEEDPGSLAHHQAVAGGVEGRADPPLGEGPQLGKTHLCVEGIGAGQAAGQHGVGPASQEFVNGKFDGVE
jgi:hypothetical protein